MKESFEVGEARAAAIGDAFDNTCPGRVVLDHVTSRWGVLILVSLRDGTLRFHELRDRVGGISEKMLSQSLRTLTRDGLIQRTVEPTIPPRVSYALTALGDDLTGPLQHLLAWIAAHTVEVIAAWDRHDHDHGTASR